VAFRFSDHERSTRSHLSRCHGIWPRRQGWKIDDDGDLWPRHPDLGHPRDMRNLEVDGHSECHDQVSFNRQTLCRISDGRVYRRRHAKPRDADSMGTIQAVAGQAHLQQEISVFKAATSTVQRAVGLWFQSPAKCSGSRKLRLRTVSDNHRSRRVRIVAISAERILVTHDVKRCTGTRNVEHGRRWRVALDTRIGRLRSGRSRPVVRPSTAGMVRRPQAEASLITVPPVA
jgi:hypothetical protein